MFVKQNWIEIFNTKSASDKFSSVQSLSCVQLFATPWTAACQASLSITNSQSLPKLISIESVMPSIHIILCRPLLLPSIFPSNRVFWNESALRIRWPKCWSFSFNISPSSNTQDWSPLGWTGWISLHQTKMAINSLITYRTNTGLISMVPDLLFIPQYVGLLLKASVSNKWYHKFTLSK